MNSTLNVTGERVIAEDYKNSDQGLSILAMHLATYEFAVKFCENKRVIDLGCGTGYGTFHLSEKSTSATGIDISGEAIQYAKDKFSKPNLEYTKIPRSGKLPFSDNSFDTAVSFQVIEHIEEDKAYLEEAYRILKPGGKLLIATPNRLARLLPFQKPWNRWHIKEYSAKSLCTLASKLFKVQSSLFMTTPPDITEFELARYQKTKWLTLPATLPFIPDAVRIKALSLASALAEKNKQTNRTITSTHQDIYFSSTPTQALNLLLICEKS